MNYRIYSALSLLTFLIFLNDKPSVAVERIVSQALPKSALSQNRESVKPIVVSKLVEQFRTADVRKRREIIRELSNSKQNIVPELVRATSDPDPLVKSAVAEVLGNLTSDAVPAIPALVEMISNTQRAIVPSSNNIFDYGDEELLGEDSLLDSEGSTQDRRIPPNPPENPENVVGITAIAALGKIGLPARKAATPALIEALEDTNPWVKLNATWALAEIGASTPLLNYWLEAMQHPDPKLRSSAAGIFLDSRSLLRKVFGSEADTTTTAPLMAALKDEDSTVRYAASQGLELLGTRALPGLIQGLKAPEPIVRLEAAELLGDMGGAAQSAVPKLVELLTDKERYVEPLTDNLLLVEESLDEIRKYPPAPDNPDKLVRVNAAIALGKLGDRKAVPALTTALKDNNPWMQLATNWALLRFGQNQGLPVVGRLLEYPKRSVQREALSQLKQYGSQSAPYLLSYYKVRLDSADNNQRNQAIIKVGEMGVAALNVVPKLRTILSGNQKDSSGYAATILGQIARDTAVAWRNENLSPQQRQKAIAEFTKVLRIMEAPNAQFNSEPRNRIRNALTRLKRI